MADRPTHHHQTGRPRDWLFVAPCIFGFAVFAAAAVYAIYVSLR